MSLFSRIRTLSVGSTAVPLLTLWRGGRQVGEDAYGNRYFVVAARRNQRRERRFVMHDGEPEATRVPPEWHGWLHHQTDQIPAENNPFRRPWIKAHLPNATGTDHAYRPPGHTLVKAERAKSASGDYEAWSPE